MLFPEVLNKTFAFPGFFKYSVFPALLQNHDKLIISA